MDANGKHSNSFKTPSNTHGIQQLKLDTHHCCHGPTCIPKDVTMDHRDEAPTTRTRPYFIHGHTSQQSNTNPIGKSHEQYQECANYGCYECPLSPIGNILRSWYVPSSNRQLNSGGNGDKHRRQNEIEIGKMIENEHINDRIRDPNIYEHRLFIEDGYNESSNEIGYLKNMEQRHLSDIDVNHSLFHPSNQASSTNQLPPITTKHSPFHSVLDTGKGQLNNIKDYVKERKLYIKCENHNPNSNFIRNPCRKNTNEILDYFVCLINLLIIIISSKTNKKKIFSSVLYFIFCILSNTSPVVSSTLSSSPSSSSSPSKLHINVIVAQSCDETFLITLKSKIATAIDNFIRNEINNNGESGQFQVTTSVFPQCNSDSVLDNLSEIFGNDTTNSIVSLASYDIHASFIPLAEIYQKAYIVCNNHVSNPLLTSPTFAPFPSFAQEALMLTKILDMYRWQHVYVIHTKFRYWMDFSSMLYYTLTSQEFYVTLAQVDFNVAGETTRILQNVGNRKVIVLLMDVTDQQEILAIASSLSMTTKHAIFTFSDSPYDVTSRSLIGLSKTDTSQSKFLNDAIKPNVNILESVFVIGSFFPRNSTSQTQNNANSVHRKRRKRNAISPLTFRSEWNSGLELAEDKSRHLLHESWTNNDEFVSNNEYENDINSYQNKYEYIRKETIAELPNSFGIYTTSKYVKNIPTKTELSIKKSSSDSKNDKSGIDYKKDQGFILQSNIDIGEGSSYVFPTDKRGSSKKLRNSVSVGDNDSSENPPSKLQDIPVISSDGYERQGQKTSSLRFNTELNSNKYSDSKENNNARSSDNFDYSPSSRTNLDPQQHNDHFIFNKRADIDTKHTKPSKTDEIDKEKAERKDEEEEAIETAESRSKREIHDFKTVQSDLDAVYDVVYLLSLAAYENYRTDADRALDSSYFISKLANISFSGATGDFGVGSDLQVSFDFAVYDFNTTSGRFEPRIFLESDEASSSSSSDWILVEQQGISWPDGVILRADRCYKEPHHCEEKGFETAYIITIVIATVAIIIIVVFVITLLRRYLTNKEMAKGPNKIIMTSADLVFIYKKDVGKSSRTMMKSRGTLTEKENTPDIIRASDPTSRSMPSLNDLNDGFTQTARYNGDLVHVKELDIEGFEMKSKLLAYIRMLRDLRHENLNPYVGFMVERENKPALVMEYCSRGSLHDMVHNDDIKLDWDFKLSLLTDLVRGMRYLHSTHMKFHGHLTSHNCVIDSRFVLKITTYGVSGIMERCKAARTMEAKDCLWSAPELLRDPVLMQKGSDKGDIYSMAIIFQEVTLRSEPYSTTGLTPEEIVRKLKKPPPLIRPSVTPQAAPPQFIQIMKQCWAEMPDMRPSLDEIYDQFKKLTGGKKANIVDTMFKMLEKYSNDLEDIVAERTMQLEEEKKKTDQLLFRMLPSTVAEALKLGQTVEAETFSEVSIYFSDIVGFTTISAMSTPMQVVDLLNDLYTMFDATIDNYDVYKVETIGDAYMVASGLPIRNGNRHAGEISTMALMLLSQCGEFTIRHMPHVPLRLRIGLHTGSCVAGVVGLTMPRFCLFGDTVNTASRMESTGAAFRIHISEVCKNVLDVLGGYKVAYRGKTELKGKGKLNTYWLVGKEGLDKELPEPPPLVGGDNHGLESLLRHMESDPNSQTQKPVGTVSPTKSTSAPDLATPTSSPQPPSNNQNNNSNSNTGSSNTLLPVPDPNNLLTSSSVSQPANLDSLQTLHTDTCKLSDQNQIISVVKVDIHGNNTNNSNGCLGRGQNDVIVVGGVNSDKSPAPDEGLEVDTDTRIVDETMETSLVGTETVKNEYNNHHSESNDSGFGSERKHSQGQEFNSCFHPCSSSSANIPDKVKRNSSLSSMTSSGNRASVISSSDVTLNHHVTLNPEGHEETLAPVSEV